MREKVIITTEYKAKPAFKGQIAGICTSNNISSVLPSELALLKNPATKKLFELKFAQSQLLSFKYENLNPVQNSKGIETLDLSSISGENSSGENQLSALVKFLRMSFNGGTDALPALKHALNLLQTSQ